MPLAAYGGRREIMDCIAPLGNVYQAGTLSGNPIATTAGIATLSVLMDQPEIYTQIEEAVSFVLRNIRIGAKIEGLADRYYPGNDRERTLSPQSDGCILCAGGDL